MKTKVPIIGLNDSGGARIQEGVMSLAGYAEVFQVPRDAPSMRMCVCVWRISQFLLVP